MAPDHAQEAGPVERAGCRSADRLCPSIGGRPHRAGSRQPEFWRHWGCHQGSSATRASRGNISKAVRLSIQAELVESNEFGALPPTGPAIGKSATPPIPCLDDNLWGGPIETPE